MPPTAYAKAMKAERAAQQQKRREKSGAGRKKKLQRTVGICGAKKRGGGVCALRAGQGTTHPGIGSCKFHGGSTPAGVRSAVAKQAVLLGAPKEINPLDAIIWCIKMTAGEIDFYTEQMVELDKKNWLEETIMGKQMHVFARERALAQERLVKFSKDAISLGLAERAVKLAEQYGNTLARLIKGILDELMPYISKEGIELIPTIVRKHLLMAEEGTSGMAAMSKVKELTA